MTRKEVIEELQALADAFGEVHDCVPVCLEEAIKLLKNDEVKGQE